MKQALLLWDIYEISTLKTQIHGVMLRGRIRKLCLEKELNVLTENATEPNVVRFATLDRETADIVKDYILNLAPDIIVDLVAEKMPNPVLSKLQVNKEDRYTL